MDKDKVKQNTMKDIKQNVINVKEIIDIFLNNKILYAKVVIITLILSAAWIFPEPRYYRTEVMLAPEMVDPTGGGGLSSLASSFGINIGGMASADAIYPTLYPDLMESPNFLMTLFDVKVKTGDREDENIECDYYTYLTKHQKDSFWKYPVKMVKRWIKSLTEKPSAEGNSKGKLTVANLSKKQLETIEAIKGKIKCTVDKKTDVATITVEDQDMSVCAQIADSVRVKLQEHITDYRTRKARLDYDYYKKLTEEAKVAYQKSVKDYVSVADADAEVSLKSIQSKIDELENDMQLKYNTYTALVTRLEAAKAKIQENTPAFTTLREAVKPFKPAGPKRMIFILGMTMLAIIATTAYKYRKKEMKVEG